MKSYTMKKVQGVPNWSEHDVLPIDTLLWTDSIDVTAQAQICYDAENFYLRLEAVEPHIRMEHKADDLMAEVCEDSCLEFFLRPSQRTDYFNFEVNPNGALYAGFGPDLDGNIRLIPMNTKILQDLQTTRTEGGWFVTYKVPFAFIRRFFPDFAPKKGDRVHANFYKCGDLTVKPHFLAWNPINREEPAFHVPQDFGCLLFGE